MVMRRTAAALLAFVLLVAGCSESGERTSERTQTAASTATSPPTIQEGTVMQLTSTAFAEGELIPSRYSCDGEDISPPLSIREIPDGTVGLALIMDDPDAPGGTWDHWVALDIAPTTEIAQDVGALGTAGTNSWGRTGYGGPCPPSGTHRYVFRVLARSAELGLPEGASKDEVLNAATAITLAEAALMGRYAR